MTAVINTNILASTISNAMKAMTVINNNERAHLASAPSLFSGYEAGRWGPELELQYLPRQDTVDTNVEGKNDSQQRRHGKQQLNPGPGKNDSSVMHQ